MHPWKCCSFCWYLNCDLFQVFSLCLDLPLFDHLELSDTQVTDRLFDEIQWQVVHSLKAVAVSIGKYGHQKMQCSSSHEPKTSEI